MQYFSKIRVLVLLFLLLVQSIPCSAENKKDFLLISPERDMLGMFASINLVLGHLYLYEKGQYDHLAGFKVDFGKIGSYYDSKLGPNWWEYFFAPLSVGVSKNANLRLGRPEENLNAWEARRHLTRQRAHKILKKYVKIKQNILDKVNAFIHENFSETMIGVHYRGTDKSTEAPRVSYPEVFEKLDKLLEDFKEHNYKIFIATDEHKFLNKAKKRYPGKIISIEAFRSKDSNAVHHSDNDPYLMGEQALMDAILLSKCTMLLRTSSSLSLWSTYYNPRIPVVMLSQRYGDKPE